jgi:hypothetical protein
VVTQENRTISCDSYAGHHQHLAKPEACADHTDLQKT